MKTIKIIEDQGNETKIVVTCELNDDGTLISMDGDLDFITSLNEGIKDIDGRMLYPKRDGEKFFAEYKKQSTTSSRMHMEGI